MDTKKTRRLNKEPLEGKLITSLPGVGPVIAKNLNEKGYIYAVDIYTIYLRYKNRKPKFQKWMKIYGNARSSQSSICYDSLKSWDEQFGEHESSSTNNVPENVQKNNTRQSLKGCVKKSSGTANKKAVQFQKATTSAQATANDSSDNTDTESTLVLPQTISKKQRNVTKSDPITSFFLSTLETVKTFPRSLQLQVKRQFFEIMINAENKLADDETEPVASTSYCSPGCSFHPQTSTPVLNKCQQDNIASSTPVLNNCLEADVHVSVSTPAVLNKIQQDNTESSTPVLNNVQQVEESPATPTVLNYYSVKEEKIDYSPVASQELQLQIVTPNNRSLGETNETIMISD